MYSSAPHIADACAQPSPSWQFLSSKALTIANVRPFPSGVYAADRGLTSDLTAADDFLLQVPERQAHMGKCNHGPHITLHMAPACARG